MEVYPIPDTPLIVHLLSAFMGLLFLQHVFRDTSFFSLMKTNMIQQVNNYFYREHDEIEDQEAEKEEPSAKLQLLYEEKYMDRYQGLPDTILFSEEELEAKMTQLLKEKEEKETAKESEDTLCQEAYQSLLTERLTNLKQSIIMEKTPLGNVIMFYNHERQSFEYYSDNTIPYRYLEVVSRKYVTTYQCKCIYVDMAKQIQQAQEKMEDKKQKEKEKEKEHQNKGDLEVQGEREKETPIKKNIFAKFKSYNKNTSVNVGSVPVDRKTSGTQTKPDKGDIVVKENANRYSYEGKIVNFSILKKVDRKVVDKIYAVSFAEFKKMQKKA